MLKTFSSLSHLSRFASKKMTVREALNTALDDQLERNPKAYIIGQQVATYQGAYKITKGLLDKYGENRVRDTPITQAGFTGLAVGSALMGLKPIVQFMTMNFAMQAIDQIINSSAKTLYMSAGELQGGIVYRGLNGPAAAVAAQHSQCFAAWYANIPGLITICPYDAQDNRGLLKAAIRSNDVIMFLENENLYGESFQVDEKVYDKDFVLPIGKAKIMREGTHVTIVAYSRNVKYSLIAAQIVARQDKISCQVINLRTIKPLDRETILNSVKKTSRLITVEDDFPFCGVGAEIGAIVHETDAFFHLDAPVTRVSAIDIPMPYAANLQQAVVPGPDTIVKAIRNVMYGVKI